MDTALFGKLVVVMIKPNVNVYGPGPLYSSKDDQNPFRACSHFIQQTCSITQMSPKREHDLVPTDTRRDQYYQGPNSPIIPNSLLMPEAPHPSSTP